MTKVWEPVPLPVYGQNYSLSNYGEFRRDKRATGARAGKIIAVSTRRDGYGQVTFSAHGKIKHAKAHVLVAAQFLGPRPKGFHINHKDGNKLNNRADNLEYITPDEHIRYTRETTVWASNRRKLNPEDVVRLREAAKTHTVKELAQMFGITVRHVSRIVNRHNWTKI